jgi:hypothetical protein
MLLYSVHSPAVSHDPIIKSFLDLTNPTDIPGCHRFIFHTNKIACEARFRTRFFGRTARSLRLLVPPRRDSLGCFDFVAVCGATR